MDVEIVEFVAPVENNKTLFVWNIRSSLTEAQIQDSLWNVFSSFGPLFLLKVTLEPRLCTPAYSALLKFYFAAHAAAAQRHTDGRLLNHCSSQLKVRLSSKQTPHFLSGSCRPLSPARCKELANHCLGFNGWSSDIITLKDLEDEEVSDGGGLRTRRLRIGCVLQLSFPRHGCSTRGSAVVQDTFSCTGPESVAQNRSKLLKRVTDKALGSAFSNVLLILLGSGNIMLEVKQTPDQFLPDETEGVLQVNHFNADDNVDEDDDDEEWDLTVS